MRFRLLTGACLAFVAVGAALAAPEIAGSLPFFSHAAHIGEGADCKDCHGDADKLDKPALARDFCAGCHEGEMQGQLRMKHVRSVIAFPHAAHAAAVECRECHADTAADGDVAGTPFVPFDKCVSCHESNGLDVAGSNCTSCHGKDMRRTAPADHAGAWSVQHGPQARWRVFERHGKDCSTCHRNDACVSCHAKSRPKTHTGLWRLRTHGFAASFNEDSCKTCHQTSACIRCHKETEPLSHRGGWKSLHGTAAGSDSVQHCAVCHGSNDCSTCHK
jgi:hypothetical protein